MKADLHCHSYISDGLLAPAAVVRRAAANGVELLALTDHDETSGLDEAREAARALNLRFLNGVETIHIVGLGIDPDNAELGAGLATIRAGRDERAKKIAEGLAEIGIHGALEGAALHVKNANLIGRVHFARFLVKQKLARDVSSVFEHYLVRGKPGYVEHRWADLEQAVAWITAAGGIAVIAHPGRYNLSTNQRGHFYSAFKACGGGGIEVCYGTRNASQQQEAARVARKYGFAASCASDFHGVGESRADLGAISPLPEDLTPVWAGLM